jgi:hypothetical protein
VEDGRIEDLRLTKKIKMLRIVESSTPDRGILEELEAVLRARQRSFSQERFVKAT